MEQAVIREVFAVINIRIWFEKKETAKYISHLDLCRCMERAIHKAKLPFWYTEGYNPHVFLTISMPLSLGYSGLRESMDVKLLNEDFPFAEIIEAMNNGLPMDIRIVDITLPKMKPGELGFSAYNIYLENQPALMDSVDSLLAAESIIVKKKTKSGIKDIDIKADFASMEYSLTTEDQICFSVTLKSSSQEGSINPRLFFEALEERIGRRLYPQTIRINCYNGQMEEFA